MGAVLHWFMPTNGEAYQVGEGAMPVLRARGLLRPWPADGRPAQAAP